MMRATLQIAGIELSVIAWLDFDQSIEPIGGSSVRRMAGGGAFKTTHWRKHRLSLSASGWIPPALWAVDYDQPFVIALPHPIALNVGESLPPGWIARTAPWAERTVTDQDNNSVRYVWVSMTVISDGPKQTNGNSASPSWELVCEES